MLAWAVLLALLGRCCGRMVTFSEMQDDTVHIQEPLATGPAGCADGSAFKFIVRKGTTNANRVLIDFMGGGACWGERCLETSSVQVQSLAGPFAFITTLMDGRTTAGARELFSGWSLPVGFGTDVGGGTDADVSTWTYIIVPCLLRPIRSWPLIRFVLEFCTVFECRPGF
jgi:hypothetical protein